MKRKWTQTNCQTWDADDGSHIRYDHTVEGNTACPWLPNHRGYAAYGPNCEYPLSFEKYRPRYKIKLINVVRKFKTPENAMKAIERQYPYIVK